MINIALPKFDRLPLDKLTQRYNREPSNSKESTMRQAIEPLTDSFLRAIDITKESIEDFVVSFPFAFNDRTKEMTHSRLQQFAQHSRARFNELVTYLNIKKQNEC